MTPKLIALSAGAGVISAVVFLSATTGPAVARLLLFLLTPFALYLAGLGIGWMSAAIAGAVGTLLIYLVGNPSVASVYLTAEALPAVVLTRAAMLSRPFDDTVEFYPVGRLLVQAALFGSAFAAFFLILLGTDLDALSKMLRTVIETFVKAEIATLPNAPTLDAAQIDEIAGLTLKMLPGALASSVMLTILFNLWLAARVTRASGLLARPWPDLAAVMLPPKTALLLAIALAGTLLLSGVAQLAAGGFAGAFMLAFMFLGLAVAHFVTRGSPWRGFLLVALYVALFIFSAPAFFILVLVGLAENVFGYRFHQQRPPPNPRL